MYVMKHDDKVPGVGSLNNGGDEVRGLACFAIHSQLLFLVAYGYLKWGAVYLILPFFGLASYECLMCAASAESHAERKARFQSWQTPT